MKAVFRGNFVVYLINPKGVLTIDGNNHSHLHLKGHDNIKFIETRKDVIELIQRCIDGDIKPITVSRRYTGLLYVTVRANDDEAEITFAKKHSTTKNNFPRLCIATGLQTIPLQQYIWRLAYQDSPKLYSMVGIYNHPDKPKL